MDINELKRKIKAKCAKGLLDEHTFGRSRTLAYWVQASELLTVAEVLAQDSSIALNWLENLTAFEIENTLVLTYFLRSTQRSAQLILRVSFEMPKAEMALVRAPSVVGVWPMALPFEREIQDLFGVDFSHAQSGPSRRFLLPDNWVGYPMRKGYVFPVEFLNVPHIRPAGHSVPDEFGVAP